MRWYRAFFPMDSLLILQSGRFFEDTQSVSDEILDFLELSSWKLICLFSEFEIEFTWDA